MEYVRLIVAAVFVGIGLIWLYRRPQNAAQPPLPRGPIVIIFIGLAILWGNASEPTTADESTIHDCSKVLDLKHPEDYAPIAAVADEDRIYYLVDNVSLGAGDDDVEADSVTGCYFDKDGRNQKLPFEFPQSVIIDGITDAGDDYNSPVTQ